MEQYRRFWEERIDRLSSKTKLTMRALFESSEERDRVVKEYGAIEGGNQTLERLEQYLTKGVR